VWLSPASSKGPNRKDVRIATELAGIHSCYRKGQIAFDMTSMNAGASDYKYNTIFNVANYKRA